MTNFSKVQHRKKYISKKKLGVMRRDRTERKGKPEIYVRVVAAAVFGCDYDSFVTKMNLGHG